MHESPYYADGRVVWTVNCRAVMLSAQFQVSTSIVPVAQTYPVFDLEACPFETVIVDVTHKCNMVCANCYTPDRSLPDMDRAWLRAALARLPPQRFIRIVGAEPTLRADLCDLIRDVRAARHHPVLMTNGLKLADRAYVESLRAAGVQVTYLSMNGAFDDDVYAEIDQLRCADRKAAAFEHLRALHMFVSVGMIVVPALNAHAMAPLLQACLNSRNVRELHFRSVGAIGRHMAGPPATLTDLIDLYCAAADVAPTALNVTARTATSLDFTVGRLRVQLTQWPDLSNPFRGRLTADGRVAPFFEDLMTHGR